MRRDIYVGEGARRHFSHHEVVEQFHDAEYIVFNFNIH